MSAILFVLIVGIGLPILIAVAGDTWEILTARHTSGRFRPPIVPDEKPPVDNGYWRRKYMAEHPEIFANWKE